MSRPSPASRNSGSALAVVSGVAGMLFGIIVGYLLATQPGASQFSSAAEAAAPAPPAAATPVVNESELQAYKDILKADPKNTRVATDLANRLYDGGRYSEAIPYYQQAFANDPKNVSLSTDLATSLFYAGRSDEALLQFDKSLAIDPTHAQTLFNLGVVKSRSKGDYAGAVKVWEKLLASNPGYADAEKLRRMIDDAKQQGGTK
jgi:tetratricopeptide (TPR) repeat protein